MPLRKCDASITGKGTIDPITAALSGLIGVAPEASSTMPASTTRMLAKVGTISYEITCSVGKRVQRRYVGGETIVLPSQGAPFTAWPHRLPRMPSVNLDAEPAERELDLDPPHGRS